MSEWIKVSDRMPSDDEDEYYLTWSSAGVAVTYYYESRFCDSFATHWMPLPEPPKE